MGPGENESDTPGLAGGPSPKMQGKGLPERRILTSEKQETGRIQRDKFSTCSSLSWIAVRFLSTMLPKSF